MTLAHNFSVQAIFLPVLGFGTVLLTLSLICLVIKLMPFIILKFEAQEALGFLMQAFI